MEKTFNVELKDVLAMVHVRMHHNPKLRQDYNKAKLSAELIASDLIIYLATPDRILKSSMYKLKHLSIYGCAAWCFQLNLNKPFMI